MLFAFHIPAFLFRIQGGELIPVLLPVIICLITKDHREENWDQSESV